MDVISIYFNICYSISNKDDLEQRLSLVDKTDCWYLLNHQKKAIIMLTF